MVRNHHKRGKREERGKRGNVLKPCSLSSIKYYLEPTEGERDKEKGGEGREGGKRGKITNVLLSNVYITPYLQLPTIITA